MHSAREPTAWGRQQPRCLPRALPGGQRPPLGACWGHTRLPRCALRLFSPVLLLLLFISGFGGFNGVPLNQLGSSSQWLRAGVQRGRGSRHGQPDCLQPQPRTVGPGSCCSCSSHQSPKPFGHFRCSGWLFPCPAPCNLTPSDPGFGAVCPGCHGMGPADSGHSP